MINLKHLTANPEEFLALLNRRGDFDHGKRVEHILRDFEAQKMARATLQTFQKSKNENAANTARALKANLDTSELIENGRELKTAILSLTETDKILDENIIDRAKWVPNVLDDSVPLGADETANQVVKQWGEPEFKGWPHYDYAELINGQIMANRLVQGSFITLTGDIARLSRAIGQFMLDHHADYGYTEVNPPLIISGEALYNTGQLPKFQNDLFEIDHLNNPNVPHPKNGKYLAPTSEVMLTNLYRNQLLNPDQLPLRLTALTKCFRREAGGPGTDTRGLIRLNEFEKVELVSIVYPEDGHDELERMTGVAESILEKLGLPYQRVLLCSGDTGFSAAKTYDLEVLMAGAKKYREISSCSLCTDFQARRADIRVRYPDNKKSLAYTLNGSALAVGRTLAAIIEYYQEDHRSLTIPEVLRPYMRGQEKITITPGQR